VLPVFEFPPLLERVAPAHLRRCAGEFLDPAYTIFIKDTVTGSPAFHGLADMIRRK
jgi:hypothetical protein